MAPIGFAGCGKFVASGGALGYAGRVDQCSMGCRFEIWWNEDASKCLAPLNFQFSGTGRNG
jgi:hypothetical protein